VAAAAAYLRALVDEQHPAHRLLQDLLRARRGLTDELADEIVSHGVHQMALFQITQPVQHVSHAQRHRGLAGTRGAGEAHVQVRPGRLQAEPLPRPVDQEQGGDLEDVLLHRHQADKFPVEGGQDAIYACGPALLSESDGGVWSQLPALAVTEGGQSLGPLSPPEPGPLPGGG
jgi:hypothetical protein